MSLLLNSYRICGEERGSFCVLDSQGKILRAETSGRLRENSCWPSIGDWVRGRHQMGDWVLIEETLSRGNALQRRGPDGQPQVFASNIDYMFVVTSANQDFNLNRLDRYLAMAFACQIQPVIIVNKIELSVDPEGLLDSLALRYQQIKFHAVSVYEDLNRDIFMSYLTQGKTAVFVGSSGVGKSSVVNWLLGRKIVKTQEIRGDDDRGRHTTTSRNLYTLENGAAIIDTPGIRSLSLMDGEGFDELFSDIVLISKKCKFRDCRHQGEPGCAIERALHSGELDENQWQSFQKLERETNFSDRKANKTFRREEKRRDVRTMREYKKIKSERARR